jgi:phytoene dehydrogenase-like protein
METDVVILGSGASALTAALAANGHGSDVMVFEKADKIGH